MSTSAPIQRSEFSVTDASGRAPLPTFRQIFERIADGPGPITEKDIGQFAKRAGIGGILGPVKRRKIIEEFMTIFDQDGDRKITWAEAQKNAHRLLVPLEVFERADSNPSNDLVTPLELKPALRDHFIEEGKSHPDQRAQVSTKLSFYMTAQWHESQSISKADFRAVWEDVMRHKVRAIQPKLQGRQPMTVPNWMHVSVDHVAV